MVAGKLCVTTLSRQKHDTGKPRSGEIYLAQCVSIGKFVRTLSSRGAAASQQESFAPCGVNAGHLNLDV